MKNQTDSNNRDDIFSNVVRAGKRTYFFDVKNTKGNDLYLTITESKKKYDKDGSGKFFFEKHKVFLYKEDFEKFSTALTECLDKIKELRESGNYKPDISFRDNNNNEEKKNDTPLPENSNNETHSNDDSSFTDVSFDELGENSNL